MQEDPGAATGGGGPRNRYAFGGGNPTSLVELDGRMLDGGGGGGGSGGTCLSCGDTVAQLFNPNDFCGSCHFDQYDGGHDTAIMFVATYLAAFQPMGGGSVSMDLSASGGPRDDRNTIAGGSSKKPGKGVGYADLLYWTDDAVYVWDAKHAGGDAERKGKKEVENKVKYLQEQLKASGDKRVAKVGFDFPPGVVPNYAKPNEMVKIWPSQISPGVIAYDTDGDE